MELATRENNYHYNKHLKEKANKLRNNSTKAEACLWKYVLKASLLLGYKFRRQRPVLNYIADFMSVELMLIIEVDSLSHTFEEAVEKDKKRQRHLENIGFTVLRFTDHEVLTSIDRVKNKLVHWIDSQPDLPPPNPRQRGKRGSKS